MIKPPKIILASTSPYRRAQLESVGLVVDCIAPGVDEAVIKQRLPDPFAAAQELARAKAEAVHQRFPDAVVIGGDQMATIDGAVLDKPGTAEKAADQLRQLAGRTHQLITAVCVLGPEGRRIEFADVTLLTMRRLTGEAIDRYIKRDCPLDCAGAYKIESAGIALFQKIETADHSAITGLPMMRLVAALLEFGIEIP